MQTQRKTNKQDKRLQKPKTQPPPPRPKQTQDIIEEKESHVR